MLRKIIRVDEYLCNGCGLCVNACHEGAIGLVNGKAKLLRDDYCDGLGNCLPVCPTGAITFEEREAAAFDEEAVLKNQNPAHSTGCPGQAIKSFNQSAPTDAPVEKVAIAKEPFNPSQLRQWPVQIKLAPVNAPYFQDAKLLIAADCAAYSHGNFHQEFMTGKITLIGCPKLDDGDYSEKLTAILAQNNIKSVTVVRMEVPCCGGIESALKTALIQCGKMIPWNVVTLKINGEIMEDNGIN